MMWKDLFSAQAADYARYRPQYPAELFAALASLAPGRVQALDVGTGNGQAARELGAYFSRVIGVDPSSEQISKAEPGPHIEYLCAPAESIPVLDASTDLITVAQAIHWFDRTRFFAEVARLLRPRGVLAFWCYGLAHITPDVDAAVHELYEDRLGPFWDSARKLIEDGYRTIEVPFAPIETPAFALNATWSLDQLVGYLGTWSPRRSYAEAHGRDALAETLPRLTRAWGAAPTREVTWPLSLRAFRL